MTADIDVQAEKEKRDTAFHSVAEAHRLVDQVKNLLHVRILGIKGVLVHMTTEGEIGSQAQAGDEI